MRKCPTRSLRSAARPQLGIASWLPPPPSRQRDGEWGLLSPLLPLPQEEDASHSAPAPAWGSSHGRSPPSPSSSCTVPAWVLSTGSGWNLSSPRPAGSTGSLWVTVSFGHGPAPAWAPPRCRWISAVLEPPATKTVPHKASTEGKLGCKGGRMGEIWMGGKRLLIVQGFYTSRRALPRNPTSEPLLLSPMSHIATCGLTALGF